MSDEPPVHKADSPEYLGAIFATSIDAIFGFDERGVIESANPAAERLFGFSQAELIGLNVSVLIPAEKWQQRQTTAGRELTAGEVKALGIACEVLCQRRGGESFPADLSLSVVKLHDRRIFTAVLRDMTERKAGQQALRESEAQFRTLADQAPVLIWVNGPEGCEFVNRAYLEFLGVASEVDVRHFDWAQFVHPDDRDRYVQAYLDCFARRAPFEAQFRFRRRDGVYRWMKSVGQPRLGPAGEMFGYVGSTFDITELVEATEALRGSEAHFHAMANAMSQLAWIARGDGHIFWYNQRWYDYTGTTAEEMEGWGWQKVHDPAELSNVLARWKASIATVEPFEMVFPLRGADGSFRQFLTRAIPLKNPAGQVEQWFGTNTDVHEIKRTDDELAASRARMEGIVGSAMDAIISVAANQRIILFNAAAEKMFRCPASEAIGCSIERFIPARFRVGHGAHIRCFGETGVSNRAMGRLGAISGLRGDGEEFPIEASISQTEAGGQKLFTVILRDVTERTRAEAASTR